MISALKCRLTAVIISLLCTEIMYYVVLLCDDLRWLLKFEVFGVRYFAGLRLLVSVSTDKD